MIENLLSGLTTIGIQMILAMSVNLFSAYVRQLTFGHAAFAAFGAYTSALLNLRLGLSFWLACPLSILVTSAIGFLVGLPCLRSPRYYLMIMTLVISHLVQYLLRNGQFAGGYFGLGRIAPPQFFGVTMAASTYWPLVMIALGLCWVINFWFQHSRYGRVLGEWQTEGGISASPAARRAMLFAFVISTAMAGLGGSLFAHFEASISPFDFNLEVSLFVLAMVVGGGLGSVMGILLGTILLGGFFETMRSLAEYRLLVSGIIFLLAGLWFPCGFLRQSGIGVGSFFRFDHRRKCEDTRSLPG